MKSNLVSICSRIPTRILRSPIKLATDLRSNHFYFFILQKPLSSVLRQRWVLSLLLFFLSIWGWKRSRIHCVLQFVPDSVTQWGVVNLLEENEIFAGINPGKHNKTKQETHALCKLMKDLYSNILNLIRMIKCVPFIFTF